MNNRIYWKEWCLVPDPVTGTNISLQEISSRNDTARQIIAGFWAHLQRCRAFAVLVIAISGALLR